MVLEHFISPSESISMGISRIAQTYPQLLFFAMFLKHAQNPFLSNKGLCCFNLEGYCLDIVVTEFHEHEKTVTDRYIHR